jgi:hypothetical protein
MMDARELNEFSKPCPDALCDARLAFALDVSLQESQVLTDALAKESPLFPRGLRTCASCCRQTLAIKYERKDTQDTTRRGRTLDSGLVNIVKRDCDAAAAGAPNLLSTTVRQMFSRGDQCAL